MRTWNVYLSGEVHTDWRDSIIAGAERLQLPITFTSAVTDHPASDAAGDRLPPVSEGFWRDHKSAKVNAMRTRTLIRDCDLAVVRFGDRYKQWNAAFDAGMLAALGKPYVTLHGEDLVHALKEVDAGALAWATDVEQVVEVLAYTVGRG
ncbi:MAG: YtoQ family protein [Planctomycetota bacterium]|jgi:YtoQ family protein